MSGQPKKRFFKMSDNFADATDEEIDALAQSIIEILYAEKKRATDLSAVSVVPIRIFA